VPLLLSWTFDVQLTWYILLCILEACNIIFKGHYDFIF
jgi:hypothetical protein